MKRVFSSEALAEIGHLKNVLEQNGIHCTIRNEQLSGALGEVPFLECLPELWVLDDAEVEAANRLIEEQRAPADSAEPWRCQFCGESNDGQYAACWSCGASDAQA